MRMELDEVQRRLLETARQAAKRAYAPYSGFRVGAAVLALGKVYVGVNVENASLGLTICAERAALARAVAEGAGPVEGVAVWCLDVRPGPDGQLCESAASPCGACRQWLAELAPRAWVVTNTWGRARGVAELLPLAFGPARA
jgi:cytidine deaminase